MTRARDKGLAFLSVLATLAIGSALVLQLQTNGAGQINRATDTTDLTRARAIAAGAILEVRTAFAKDGAISPREDHMGEAWATAAQDPIAIPGGAIEVQVTDLAGRININAFAATPPMRPDALARALAQVDLDPSLAARIAAQISRSGPVQHLAQLGFAPQDTARLSTVATALPGETDVNLNTAPPPVIRALYPQAGLADRILDARAKAGFLTQADLRRLGAFPIPGTGWATSQIRVIASVTQGSVTTIREIDLFRDPQTPTQVFFSRQTSLGARP